MGWTIKFNKKAEREFTTIIDRQYERKMMCNKGFFIGFLLATITTISWANECHLKYGGHEMTKGSFDGPTECHNVEQETLSVNGPLTMCHSKIGSVSVNGPLTIRHSHINKLKVNGFLKAYHSHFKTIRAHGKLKLHNSEVDHIIYTKSPSWGHYKVYLYNGTQVKHDINFQQGGGIVYKAQNVKVKGDIHGAQVESMS